MAPGKDKPANRPGCADIRKRIGAKQHEIGGLAWRDGAEPVAFARESRRRNRCGAKHVGGRQASLGQQRQLVMIARPAWNGVGADKDGDAPAMRRAGQGEAARVIGAQQRPAMRAGIGGGGACGIVPPRPAAERVEPLQPLAVAGLGADIVVTRHMRGDQHGAGRRHPVDQCGAARPVESGERRASPQRRRLALVDGASARVGEEPRMLETALAKLECGVERHCTRQMPGDRHAGAVGDLSERAIGGQRETVIDLELGSPAPDIGFGTTCDFGRGEARIVEIEARQSNVTRSGAIPGFRLRAPRLLVRDTGDQWIARCGAVHHVPDGGDAVAQHQRMGELRCGREAVDVHVPETGHDISAPAIDTICVGWGVADRPDRAIDDMDSRGVR
eukprot:Opistho-1_new@73550